MEVLRNLLFACSLLFLSCNLNHEDTIPGNTPDTVKLSTKTLQFNSEGSVKEIQTEGDRWNMSPKMDKDEELDFSREELKIELGAIAGYDNTVIKFESEWFVVSRGLKKITVELKPNTTSQKRKLRIGVNDRNYFDEITIEQNGQSITD